MITAFLPCRKGSQRIPNKNVKTFGEVPGGLLSIKLRQLVACDAIDEVVVSSNDARVLQFVEDLESSKLRIDERPDELGSSSTTTDELIAYVPSIITSGNILWTHVTSPFITSSDYSRIINTYFEKLSLGFDSLMTVQKHRGFFWSESGPLNYRKEELKWPMTQNLSPIYEVDSGAFLSSH